MDYIIKFSLLILAYLLGSIPFGYIVAKTKGIDITTTGSKNIGATNVTRTLGLRYGILVFALDALKAGLIVSLFTLKILPRDYAFQTPLFYGFASVLGHSFSIFLKFKGGKAVACSAGVLIAYDPLVAFIVISVFTFIVKATKYVSLGSLVAAGLAFILSVAFTLLGRYEYYTQMDYPVFYFPIFTLVFVWLIFLRHKKNIENLKNQTETKIDLTEKK